MAPDICVMVGRRIRYLRTKLGMSQEQLAGQAGLSRVGLSNIETGKAEPGLRTIGDLARVLGIKASELLEGID
jgi:transcriptional regulator with XRE-family HTH domain